MEITVTIHIEQSKVNDYERSLRELPGRTDEDWQQHLAYALHDEIDKTIEQARLYREWRGEPPIYKLRQLAADLFELVEDTKNGELMDIIINSPLKTFYDVAALEDESEAE